MGWGIPPPGRPIRVLIVDDSVLMRQAVRRLLRELAPLLPHRMLATDVDVTIVERARRADRYVQADLKNVSPVRLRQAFTHGPEGACTVRPEIRSLVDIRLHNLLTPPPTHGFDLILCRNVAIYFTEDAKAALYEHLVDALRPGGVLFVGGTEMVASAHRLGLTSIGPLFYRKDEAAASAPRPFARPVVAARPAVPPRVAVGAR